ncbi:MAG TPA: Crp/Fnr family transcriptional regulator [Armatimonadaceae bacterium]|nr:Crp/Fnr family transcriptional regulator [Armatimonadaceae bacterium]
MPSEQPTTKSDPLIARLKGVPLFSRLDDAALALVAQQCWRARYPAREALFHQGDPGHTLYVILSGSIDIKSAAPETGEPVHQATRHAGEHIGELSLLDDQGRSASAFVGPEPCEVLILHRDNFLALLERERSVMRAVLATLAARLRESVDQTTARQTRDVKGRLAHYLLERARADGEPTGNGRVRLRLNETREAIAARIGAKRETVSRALSSLHDARAATRGESRDTFLLDTAKLEKLRSL